MKKNTIDRITDSKTLSAIITVKFIFSIIGGIIGFIVCMVLLFNFTKVLNAAKTGNTDGLPTSYYDEQFEEAKTQADANIAEIEEAFAASSQRGAELQEQYDAAYEQFQATKEAIMNAQGQVTTHSETTNDN